MALASFKRGPTLALTVRAWAGTARARVTAPAVAVPRRIAVRAACSLRTVITGPHFASSQKGKACGVAHTLFTRGHEPHGLIILVNPGKSNMGRTQALGVRQYAGDGVIFGQAVGIDVDFRLRVLFCRILEIGVHRGAVH